MSIKELSSLLQVKSPSSPTTRVHPSTDPCVYVVFLSARNYQRINLVKTFTTAALGSITSSSLFLYVLLLARYPRVLWPTLFA